MKKFDLKKAILENKATFFSSLNEGQHSWMTQDTGKQIGSERENTIDVYMFDNKGNKWYEPNYKGYGEFGGKDYYELLDQMNGGSGDRSRGINLAFDKIETDGEILYPALVTKSNYDWKSHDFTKEAEDDPNQSWLPYEEYSYHDEEIEEGYDEFKRVEKGKKKTVAKNKGEEEVYGAGVKKGEEIEKKKMKMSEFKAKIKEMILAEMNLDVTDETSGYDFLAELEEMLNEASEFDINKPTRIAEFIKALDALVDEYHAELYLSDDLFNAIEMVKRAANEAINLNEADEKAKKEDADIEAADDVAVGDEEITTDTEVAEVDPNVKAVQDALTQAQTAAQQLGDKKLINQIGNTITFFTRAHVVEKPGGAVAEVYTPDETMLANRQYMLEDWWNELPYEEKEEIFHKTHEEKDTARRPYPLDKEMN